MLKHEVIRTVIKHIPGLVPFLSERALYIAFNGEEPPEVKTVEYYLAQMKGLIRAVYNNILGGEFIDIMANLISGQLRQAYELAWMEAGTGGAMPDYLEQSLQQMILGQYEYVDGFYREIVDARVDGTPVELLLQRAQAWAHQWEVAYREALQLIHLDTGGNMMWVKGNTEQGCSTCAALNGIVMSAKEWEELDVHPRGYPNPKLECEGGGPVNNCDCELSPTEQRRSPQAYQTVLNIVTKV